jgi:hypothetical protein
MQHFVPGTANWGVFEVEAEAKRLLESDYHVNLL